MVLVSVLALDAHVMRGETPPSSPREHNVTENWILESGMMLARSRASTGREHITIDETSSIILEKGDYVRQASVADDKRSVVFLMAEAPTMPG